MQAQKGSRNGGHAPAKHGFASQDRPAAANHQESTHPEKKIEGIVGQCRELRHGKETIPARMQLRLAESLFSSRNTSAAARHSHRNDRCANVYSPATKAAGRPMPNQSTPVSAVNVCNSHCQPGPLHSIQHKEHCSKTAILARKPTNRQEVQESFGNDATEKKPGAAGPRHSDHLPARSSRRRILPTLVLGKSSRNSMYFGTL